MIRHRPSTLAPPPPPPEMAQSPSYTRLPASAKALLVLIEIEVASAGGMLAAMNTDDICAATGMRRPALLAALDQLSAAGFIVFSMSEQFCLVAPSMEWRRA
jgi:hypothetical protein